MAYDVDYDDLSYGDETRRNGDYVSLPHDEENDDVDEGAAVSFDGTHLQAAADGDALVGVLYTYQYAGDSGGAPQPESNIRQDRNATVKTSGTVKARVASDVSAGDALEPGVDTDGEFHTVDSASAEVANAVALSDAREQDDADGDTTYYAEVLLR